MRLEGASLISVSKNHIMHQLIIPVSTSNLGLYRKIKIKLNQKSKIKKSSRYSDGPPE